MTVLLVFVFPKLHYHPGPVRVRVCCVWYCGLVWVCVVCIVWVWYCVYCVVWYCV